MNPWIIPGSILVVGFFICLTLILRGRWLAKKKPIEDYEKERDKLTFRKKKEEVVESSGGGLLSLNNLHSIVLAIVTLAITIFVAMTILNQLNIAVAADNSTAYSGAFNSAAFNASSQMGDALSSMESFFPLMGVLIIFAIMAILITTIWNLGRFDGTGL